MMAPSRPASPGAHLHLRTGSDWACDSINSKQKHTKTMSSANESHRKTMCSQKMMQQGQESTTNSVCRRACLDMWLALIWCGKIDEIEVAPKLLFSQMRKTLCSSLCLNEATFIKPNRSLDSIISDPSNRIWQRISSRGKAATLSLWTSLGSKINWAKQESLSQSSIDHFFGRVIIEWEFPCKVLKANTGPEEHCQHFSSDQLSRRLKEIYGTLE